jgi:hypothetical protein
MNDNKFIDWTILFFTVWFTIIILKIFGLVTFSWFWTLLPIWLFIGGTALLSLFTTFVMVFIIIYGLVKLIIGN